MSPEQAEGGDVGPPSDMFSFGAVLAFAATGEGPFGDGSAPALAYRVVYAEANLDHLPVEVRSLAERCLVKNPGERLAAADLLAEVGGAHPMSGWIPESIIRAFTEDPALTAVIKMPTGSRVQDFPTPTLAGDAARTVTARKMLPSPGLAADHSPPDGRGERTPRRLLCKLRLRSRGLRALVFRYGCMHVFSSSTGAMGQLLKPFR